MTKDQKFARAAADLQINCMLLCIWGINPAVAKRMTQERRYVVAYIIDPQGFYSYAEITGLDYKEHCALELAYLNLPPNLEQQRQIGARVLACRFRYPMRTEAKAEFKKVSALRDETR